MAPQPGILSSQIPPGEDWVPRALADIRREMRELGPSIMHSFQSVVDRLDAQDAAFAAQQATLTTTVADLTTAQATLATTVSGLSAAVADINTLVGQQVASGFNGATASNFAVSTNATKASCDIVVPAGYTRAVVMVTADVSVKNTGASADLLYASAMAVSSGGGESGVYLLPGEYASLPASAVKMPTGLTGGSNLTCTVRCRTGSGAAWSADALMVANVNAIALFLR